MTFNEWWQSAKQFGIASWKGVVAMCSWAYNKVKSWWAER